MKRSCGYSQKNTKKNRFKATVWQFQSVSHKVGNNIAYYNLATCLIILQRPLHSCHGPSNTATGLASYPYSPATVPVIMSLHLNSCHGHCPPAKDLVVVPRLL